MILSTSLFLGDAIYILDLNQINQIYGYFIYICLRISNNQQQLNKTIHILAIKCGILLLLRIEFWMDQNSWKFSSVTHTIYMLEKTNNYLHHLQNYTNSGAVKELEGWWKSIVQVTITPSNAQTAGTRPKPNLVIEGGNWWITWSCGEISAFIIWTVWDNLKNVIINNAIITVVVWPLRQRLGKQYIEFYIIIEKGNWQRWKPEKLKHVYKGKRWNFSNA